MTHGSWVRFGIQQTPLVDYQEGIYRYRFQGHDVHRARGLPHLRRTPARRSTTTSATNFGDIHVGIYNGEGYSKPEANDQQAFQIRGTVRPFATAPPVLRGLRFTGFYDNDDYMKNDEKKRALFADQFEHKYLNAGYDYLHTDGSAHGAGQDDHSSNGYSFWLTPKTHVRRSRACSGTTTSSPTTPIRQPQARSRRSSASPTGSSIRATSRRRMHARLRLARASTTSRRRCPSRPRSPCTGWSTSSVRRIISMSVTQDIRGARGRLRARRRRRRAADAYKSTGPARRFPYPIYSKWFSEYNKLHPNVADQLPVDRIGRRHPSGHQSDRVLRRHRRPDDRRPDAGGARQDPALPDGARRGGAGLQHSGRQRGAEVHRRAAGRHLPRQDHEVERCGHREAEPRREPARRPTSPSCTARTARARPTSASTTWPRSRPSGRARSASRRR